MGEFVSIKLDSCEKIIENDFLDRFFLGKKQQDQKTYSKVEDAIKAYVKDSGTKEGDILIYRSEHLNPQRGGWYDPNRRDKFRRVVYSVTSDQLLQISGLKASERVTVEFYKISKREAEKVSYEVLIRAWWETISPEVKKQWLDKLLEELLFSKVMDNPRRFL